MRRPTSRESRRGWGSGSSEGRRGGLLSRRSWLLILLLFLCCLSVFLFSGQRATRTNCGEEEVIVCVRACVAVIVLRGESASLVMFVAPSFSPRNRHRCASDDAPVC